MDGKKVLKGILGGIGGGLQGAAKGMGTVDINDQNTNHAKEIYDLANPQIEWGKLKEDIKSSNENAVSDILLKTVYGEAVTALMLPLK